MKTHRSGDEGYPPTWSDAVPKDRSCTNLPSRIGRPPPPSKGTDAFCERMTVAHACDVLDCPQNAVWPRSTSGGLIVPGVKVIREGRVEPFLRARPTLSSAAVRWTGLAVEDYSIPACVIPRHEHIENFLHVVLHGSVNYEVLTRGRTRQFYANPGTTFILPRGTVDELRWGGPTHRIAVALHPMLLVNALDETAHERDIELTEHWNLTDRHIMAVLPDGSTANRWPMRWPYIFSLGTPCNATCRSPFEVVCQAIVSSACLIILGTTWRTISGSRN